MARNLIINESAARRIISEEYLTKQDFDRLVKNDKNLEKKIKAMIADAVNDLFRTLWQRRNFYDSEIRK